MFSKALCIYLWLSPDSLERVKVCPDDLSLHFLWLVYSHYWQIAMKFKNISSISHFFSRMNQLLKLWHYFVKNLRFLLDESERANDLLFMIKHIWAWCRYCKTCENCRKNETEQFKTNIFQRSSTLKQWLVTGNRMDNAIWTNSISWLQEKMKKKNQIVLFIFQIQTYLLLFRTLRPTIFQNWSKTS